MVVYTGNRMNEYLASNYIQQSTESLNIVCAQQENTTLTGNVHCLHSGQVSVSVLVECEA